MDWQKDAHNMKQTLQHAGYDVQVNSEILARRDRGALHEILIDRSGQLRCVETSMTSAPSSSRVTQGRSTYRVLLEEQRVANIASRLDVEDLPAVLRDLDDILRKGGVSSQ